MKEGLWVGSRNERGIFMPDKVAILLDGGFVKKKLSKLNGHFATVQEIVGVCHDIMADDHLKTRELFRIYYYDAPPFEGRSKNPISGATLNFSATPQAAENRSLIDLLELQPDFAIGIGGHLAMPPLPHHRAYGSVPRRFGWIGVHRVSNRGSPSELK